MMPRRRAKAHSVSGAARSPRTREPLTARCALNEPSRVQDRFVTTDLDTLATALYVKADDLLKASPYLGRWRPAVGIAPKLSDAELVTLAVMQALLGFTSESRWLRHARAHLGHLFPYLPLQPGYNLTWLTITETLQVRSPDLQVRAC